MKKEDIDAILRQQSSVSPAQSFQRMADSMKKEEVCAWCEEPVSECGGVEGHDDEHVCNHSVPGFGGAVGPGGCDVCKAFE